MTSWTLLMLTAAAFITTLIAALGKCPLWVAVILLCIVQLISVAPH